MSAAEATAVGGAARGGGRRGLAGWVRRHTFEIVLVTPLLAYILLLTVAPIVDTFRLSFSAPQTGFGTGHSYQAVAKDPIFRRAVVNTVIVALLSLTLEVGVGLAVALALHVKFFGRGFARTVLL